MHDTMKTWITERVEVLDVLDIPRKGANPEDHHYCESCPFDYNKTGILCGITWPRSAACLIMRKGEF